MLVVILTTSFFNGQQTKASQIEDRKNEYEIMQQVKQNLVQETYVGEFLISQGYENEKIKIFVNKNIYK